MRNPFFDGLKAFAIFLVVWGHCIQFLLTGDKEEDILFRFIYSFHMPLFALVSGYFCAKSLSMPFKELVVHRARQLLLPCVTWFLRTYAIPKTLMYPIWGATKEYTFMAYADVLYQNFWFLKSMFVCYVLAYFGKRYSWIIALFVSLFLSDSCFNISFLFPAFVVGLMLKEYGIIEKHTAKPLWVSLPLFMVLVVPGGRLFYDIPVLQEIINHNWIKVYEFLWKNTYMTIIGISGSMTVIFMFKMAYSAIGWAKMFDVMAKFGQYTLPVYILQYYMLSTETSKYMLCFDNMGFCLSHFVVFPVMSVIICYVCSVIIKFTLRYKLVKRYLWGY